MGVRAWVVPAVSARAAVSRKVRADGVAVRFNLNMRKYWLVVISAEGSQLWKRLPEA
jgi:hypothetical protein